MEDFVRLLSTDEGDVYHITLSEDTVLFSQETLKIINGVRVVGIDLRRLVGISPTGHITAKGIDDTFYFHLIYRERHAHLASVISQDIKEGYSK